MESSAEPQHNDPGDAPGSLRLVEEFANTLDVECGDDEIATPEAAASWLSGRPEFVPAGVARPPAISTENLGQLHRLRTAIREIVRANHESTPSPAAHAELNAIAATVPLYFRLGPGPDARLEPPAAEAVPYAIGRLLAAIHDAIADGSWSRLKICPADTCQWVFYDRSRNRSGTWCSMRVCGNRAKVRRYQEKLRDKAAKDG